MPKHYLLLGLAERNALSGDLLIDLCDINHHGVCIGINAAVYYILHEK